MDCDARQAENRQGVGEKRRSKAVLCRSLPGAQAGHYLVLRRAIS